MKVLHVSPYPTPHDARFIRAMRSAGENACYLPLDTSFEWPVDWPADLELIDWPGLRVADQLDPASVVDALPNFEAAVRSARADILQAGPVCSAGFLAATIRPQIPLVSMLWGYDILIDADQSSLLEAMARLTLQRADRVLIDCNAVREKAVAVGNVPPHKFVQLPWGVDLARFNPPPPTSPLRKNLGWLRNAVFISARSWGPLYGIDTLLEGFNQAYQTDPSIRLILIGDGALRPMVEKFILDHQLGAVVYLVGRVPENEMPRWLQHGDFYVSCSRTDGSSVTLLEAMAIGLPCLVTDIGGNREWIDEKTGFLFAPNDPAELGHRILEAAALDCAARESIRIVARERVAERADFSKNVRLLFDAHQAIV